MRCGSFLCGGVDGIFSIVFALATTPDSPISGLLYIVSSTSPALLL